MAAGYPPDIVASPTSSLWTNYWASFWEVTQCQWQKRLDASYDTYGAGPGNYNYVARLSASDVGAQVASFATTGRILRPLLTVAGTMDALLPIDHHARAYARLVRSRAGDDEHGHGRHVPGRDDTPPYRLYEVQNGNHIETYADTFPELELIQPHAQRAFELLVRHVEQRTPLPPDQCIGRGGLIVDAPSAVGTCPNLLAP